jgi:hypothetical protein
VQDGCGVGLVLRLAARAVGLRTTGFGRTDALWAGAIASALSPSSLSRLKNNTRASALRASPLFRAAWASSAIVIHILAFL